MQKFDKKKDKITKSDNYDNEEKKELEIIKAYLINGLSHRDIEKNILGIDSPVRGGGFIAMKFLHELGINGEKKGVLKYKSIEYEIRNAQGNYLETLLKLKDKL